MTDRPLLTDLFNIGRQNSPVKKLFFAYEQGDYNFCTSFDHETAETLQSADVYHCIANAFYCKNKFKEALTYYNKAIQVSSKYHVYYHYQGSAIYFNRFLVFKVLGNLNHAELDKKHCIHLYHNFFDGNNDLTLQNPEQYILQNDKNINSVIFKNTNYTSLYRHFDRLFYDKKFDECIDCLNEIIKISNAEHFNYHVTSSLQYLNRARCFIELNRVDIAISDLQIAADFDAKNQYNQEIKSLHDHCLKFI